VGEGSHREIDGVRVPLLGFGPADPPPNFSDSSLFEEDLSGLDLRGANFANCQIVCTSFAGSNLAGASFKDAGLDDVDLTGATIAGASFRNATTIKLTATDLDVTDVDLTCTTLRFDTGAAKPVIKNLTAARFYHSVFQHMDLSGQDLPRMGRANPSGPCDWQGVNFTGANLTEANFESSSIVDCDFTRVVAPGVKFTMASIEGTPLTGADFSGGDFTTCHLSNANLSDANLSDTKFSVSVASHSRFTDANFSGANFSNLNSQNRPVFRTCDFTGANFSGADLGGSDFAYLSGHSDHEGDPPLSKLTGCMWVGARTDGINVSFDNGYTVHDSTFGEVDVDDWHVAPYEQFSVRDAAAHLGVDVDTLAVLAWGGVLELRSNVTGLPPEGGAVDVDRYHVPVWALQNYS
jgi:uncharacterized protein YjbI with pentapeptide repeats